MDVDVYTSPLLVILIYDISIELSYFHWKMCKLLTSAKDTLGEIYHDPLIHPLAGYRWYTLGLANEICGIFHLT